MLTIIKRCVARKTQVNSTIFHVLSIILSFLDGFWNYFAEVFTIIIHATMYPLQNQVGSSEGKVTLSSQRSKIGLFVMIFYSLRIGIFFSQNLRALKLISVSHGI